MNLSVNARDAMPHCGTPTIATANVDLDEHYAAMHRAVIPGPHVALLVTDTETGMSPRSRRACSNHSSPPRKSAKAWPRSRHRYGTPAERRFGQLYSEIGKGTSFKAT